ncbi:MAG: SpoIIE family protein phosphatase, partial [Bacteroidales bacterium]|nr:SpoIIE family protein phosphatase [Bacteroidales bacterium]
EVAQYLELAQRHLATNNFAQASHYLNKAAFAHWEANDQATAIKYFNETAELKERIGDYVGLKAVYSNMALIYSDMNMYDMALECFQKSLGARRKSGNQADIAAGLVDVAYISIAQKQYDKAIRHLDEGYKLAQAEKHSRLILTCLRLYAQCYELMGNSAKASEYHSMMAMYEQQLSTQQLRSEYDVVITQAESEAETQRKLRSEQEAEMQLQALQARFTRDSLNRIVLSKQDSLQKAEERDRQRQIEIDNLELQRALQNEVLERQQAHQRQQLFIIYTAIAFAGLLVLVLVLIYRTYRQKQRDNEQLLLQNEEIEKQRNQIQKQHENINKSINYAQGIQKALLPPQENLTKLFPESFILFKPRDIVSGDYYYFKEIPQGYGSDEMTGKVVVAAVDCTGHGVPGAFLSMIGCNLLNEIVHSGEANPGSILRRLNNEVVRTLRQEETDNRDGMDMSLCVVDTVNKTLEFSGAKNPLIYVTSSEMGRLKPDKNCIAGGTGILSDDFDVQRVQVTEPTWFYMFSDGFVDQFGGPNGRKFMMKQFSELLGSIAMLPAQQQRTMLKNVLREWIGNLYHQIDDILIVGFKLTP